MLTFGARPADDMGASLTGSKSLDYVMCPQQHEGAWAWEIWVAYLLFARGKRTKALRVGCKVQEFKENSQWLRPRPIPSYGQTKSLWSTSMLLYGGIVSPVRKQNKVRTLSCCSRCMIVRFMRHHCNPWKSFKSSLMPCDGGKLPI